MVSPVAALATRLTTVAFPVTCCEKTRVMPVTAVSWGSAQFSTTFDTAGESLVTGVEVGAGAGVGLGAEVGSGVGAGIIVCTGPSIGVGVSVGDGAALVVPDDGAGSPIVKPRWM